MFEMKEMDKLLADYRLIEVRLQVCIGQKEAMDKEVQENIDKDNAESQWKCRRAAKMSYGLQKQKNRIEEQRYKKLYEICEHMHGKKETKGLSKFVRSAKQKISFIGSKVLKKHMSMEQIFEQLKMDNSRLSLGDISYQLNNAEKMIQKGDDIDFGNLTFEKLDNYKKWNRTYGVALHQLYRNIYKTAEIKMLGHAFEEKHGRKMLSTDSIDAIRSELEPELEEEFMTKLAKDIETKKAELVAQQPLKTPVINAKPKKKEELSAEQQQRFEDIHAKLALPSGDISRLESAEDRQMETPEEKRAKIQKEISRIMSEAEDKQMRAQEEKRARIQEEISRIKSEINDIYNNAASPFGFTEDESQKLDAKRSEVALLQGQLDDMANKEKRKFEEKRQAKIEADKVARAERIADINKRNAVEEARRILSHLKVGASNYNNETIVSQNEYTNIHGEVIGVSNNKKQSNVMYFDVTGLSDEELLDTYNQIAQSPSMADRLNEARLEAQAEKQNVELQPDLSINAEEKGQETVTPESVFGTPVGLEPIPMEVTEKDMEPEVTPVPIISESEELRNGIDNETIEEIAANLTPDMYEHYRSVMNSFEPDSEEYKNASAVVDMYDRQSAINTLHQGNSR